MTADDDLWQHLVERRELIRGDDGMWMYWPAHWSHGGLRSNALRSLAARMDRENEENAERISSI